MSQENEKLKKETQNLGLERDRLAQQSLMISSSVNLGKPELKRIHNQKFLSGRYLVCLSS